MSEEAEPVWVDILNLEVKQDRAGITIVVEGEFDMTGTERFWAFLTEVLAADPISITVDARGLEFVDSSGLLALERARDAATRAGVAFHVAEPSAALRRTVELAGVEHLLLPQ